jgi:hypothetical protein
MNRSEHSVREASRVFSCTDIFDFDFFFEAGMVIQSAGMEQKFGRGRINELRMR